MSAIVEPCAACERHVRTHETVCPFCGTPRAPSDAQPPRSGLRSRLAVVAGAALLVGACQGEPESGGEGEGTSSGGEAGDQVEQSCAGICGSHHDEYCPEEEDQPCESPPYGTPPIDDLIV